MERVGDYTTEWIPGPISVSGYLSSETCHKADLRLVSSGLPFTPAAQREVHFPADTLKL